MLDIKKIKEIQSLKNRLVLNGDDKKIVTDFLKNNISQISDFETIDNYLIEEHDIDIIEEIKKISTSFKTQKEMLQPLIDLNIISSSEPYVRTVGIKSKKFADLDDLISYLEDKDTVIGVIPFEPIADKSKQTGLTILYVVILSIVTTLSKAFLQQAGDGVAIIGLIVGLVIIFARKSKNEDDYYYLAICGINGFWFTNIRYSDTTLIQVKNIRYQPYVKNSMKNNIRFLLDKKGNIKPDFYIKLKDGKVINAKYNKLNKFNSIKWLFNQDKITEYFVENKK